MIQLFTFLNPLITLFSKIQNQFKKSFPNGKLGEKSVSLSYLGQAMVFINQKISDTKSQESPTKMSPIAACLRMVYPFLCLFSSPAAVTIWNPPRRSTTSAMRLSIPNVRLMKFLTVSNNFELVSAVSVPTIHWIS